MKLGVIADCQYADINDFRSEEFDRRFRLSTKKLQESIDYFNSQDIDFVVHLGDIIDQGVDNLEPLREILESSNHQIYHVLGNHDFYVTTESDPRRNNHTELLNFLNMPAKYYSFEVENIRFIVLDTNEVGTIEWEPDTPEYQQGLKVLKSEEFKGYIYAKNWNGGISSEQLSWLRSVINEATNKNQRIVMFAHHQLFPENRENMLKKELLLEVLENNQNIIAFMNGHNHHGDYGVFESVPCITFKGMVETVVNAYAVAEITNDEINIYGYGREISRKIKTREV